MTIDPPELNDAQKVTAAKSLVEKELAGVYFTDQATTEAPVAAAIAAVEASFEDGVGVLHESDKA